MAIFMLLVPDVPNDVSIQLGRQKFITSKIIDQVCESVRIFKISVFCLFVFVCTDDESKKMKKDAMKISGPDFFLSSCGGHVAESLVVGNLESRAFFKQNVPL